MSATGLITSARLWPDDPLDRGLVCDFRLDRNTGLALPDHGPRRLHVTGWSGPDWVADPLGPALNFLRANSDEIDLATIEGHIPRVSGTGSLEVFFRWNGEPGGTPGYVFFARNEAGGAWDTRLYVLVYWSGAAYEIATRFGNTGNTTLLSGPTLGEAYHVVLTWSAGTAQGFVNGEQVVTDLSYSYQNADPDNTFLGSSGGGGYTTDTNVLGLRAYDRELSPAQARGRYEASTARASGARAFLWVPEAAVTVVHDLSATAEGDAEASARATLVSPCSTAATGDAAVSARLVRKALCSSSATGDAGVTAPLSLTKSCAATATGDADASANLSLRGIASLNAEGAGGASASASLTVAASLASSGIGEASASAALMLFKHLGASVGSGAGATADLFVEGTFRMEVVASGDSEAAARLWVRGTEDLSAVAVGEASVSAPVTMTYLAQPPVRFSYIDADGNSFDMAASCRLMDGFGGVGLVAPEHHWRVLPDRDGAEHMAARTPNRVMNFVVRAASATRSDAWADKGGWADAFSPQAEAGTLRATLPDDTIREIRARYAGGIGFNTDDAPPPHQQGFPVQLASEEPHWRAYSYDSAAANFNGATPVSLACVNGGDVPVYPVVTITASVDHPVLVLAGGTMDIDVSVTSGSLVIDCAGPTVSKDGVNMMGSATVESEFWELSRGTNEITLTADSGSGECSVKWKERYAALKPA